MLTANYSSFGVIDTVDTWSAMFDFIAAFAVPPVPIDELTGELQIIRGYENEGIKPFDSQEFIVFTKISETRIMTPLFNFVNIKSDENPQQMQLSTLYQEVFQIDFYGLDDTCNSRARSFLNFGFSDVGHSFLEPYNISLINVNDIGDVSYTDESGLMVKRYICEVSIQAYRTNSLDSSWFDDVNLESVVDIDAKYKPAQEN